MTIHIVLSNLFFPWIIKQLILKTNLSFQCVSKLVDITLNYGVINTV